MNDARIRQIVREEIRVAFEASGLNLDETVHKGDTVETPHGKGEVLSLNHPWVRVKLNTGATMRMNRSKVVVRN